MKKIICIALILTFLLSACGESIKTTSSIPVSNSISQSESSSSSILSSSTPIESSKPESSEPPKPVTSADLAAASSKAAAAPPKEEKPIRYFICQNKEDKDNAIELPSLEYPFAVNTKLDLPLLMNERNWADNTSESGNKDKGTKKVFFYQEDEKPFLFVRISRPKNLTGKTKELYTSLNLTTEGLYRVRTIRDTYIKVLYPTTNPDDVENMICIYKNSNAFDYYDMDGNLLENPETLDAFKSLKYADKEYDLANNL